MDWFSVIILIIGVGLALLIRWARKELDKIE